MKSENGNVEVSSELDSVSAGTGGPSSPEPVVHPLPTAAFSTNPIAVSLERGEIERLRSFLTGAMLKSLESD